LKRVIALRHVPWEDLGAFERHIVRRGAEVEYVDLFAGSMPSAVGEPSTLFVMGGPMGVYEGDRYPFLRREVEFIRSCLESGVPTVGVCLGSQLLAAALGAGVYPNPQGQGDRLGRDHHHARGRKRPHILEVRPHGDCAALARGYLRPAAGSYPPGQLGCDPLPGIQVGQ